MYMVRIFMKCMHVCATQKSLLTLYLIINKPDFPSLADEIAEQRPDMNIKVAAFTVSEKSGNTWYSLLRQIYFRDEVHGIICIHLHISDIQ